LKACGAFILNIFLLIFEVLDSLFENPLKITSYKGAAPLNAEEGPIPRVYPTIVNDFPHTLLGQFYCEKSVYQHTFGDSTGESNKKDYLVEPVMKHHGATT
jgi:hypothetical protein